MKKTLNEIVDSLMREGLTGEHLRLYLKHNSKPSVDNVKRFEMITTQMATIYARKNKDYGSSFDISLDEDGLLAAKIRKGDKFRRFCQLIENEAEVKDESIRDTLIDDAVYSIMTVMWMDAQEEKSANIFKDVTPEEFRKVVSSDPNFSGKER